MTSPASVDRELGRDWWGAGNVKRTISRSMAWFQSRRLSGFGDEVGEVLRLANERDWSLRRRADSRAAIGCVPDAHRHNGEHHAPEQSEEYDPGDLTICRGCSMPSPRCSAIGPTSQWVPCDARQAWNTRRRRTVLPRVLPGRLNLRRSHAGFLHGIHRHGPCKVVKGADE